MTEQPGSSPKESHPKPEVYTRLPDGSIANVFGLIERDRRNLETQMSTGSLRTGDLIEFQSINNQGTTSKIIFGIQNAKWDNLGMGGGFAPCPTLVGILDGADLPDKIKGKVVTFVGSGYGGSMVTPGILITGRSPYFHSPEGEYRMPYIDYFEVFRRDAKGNLRSLDPNQLDAEAQGKTPKHEERLSKTEKLMKLFGFSNFDFRQCSKPSEGHFRYEDGKYIAEFQGQMAMGNQLVIFDKQNQNWMELKYLNYMNADFLQISFANISGHNLKDLFLSNRLTDGSGIHRSGSAITTFTSSGRYGIEVINYKPSDKETFETLDIPKWGSEIVQPDIQIWPDGQIEVPGPYPLSMVEQEHPGLLTRIKNSTHVNTFKSDDISVRIGSKNIKLKNPDAEIDKLIQHFSNKA